MKISHPIVYSRLVQCALRESVLTPRAVFHGMELSPDQQNAVLGEIDAIELASGRPRLSAVVVKMKTGLPIRKWFTLTIQDSGVDNPDKVSFSMSLESRKRYWKEYVNNVYSHINDGKYNYEFTLLDECRSSD